MKLPNALCKNFKSCFVVQTIFLESEVKAKKEKAYEIKAAKIKSFKK